MAQTGITLTPKEFSQLLESQSRFKHLKYNLIADCELINNLFSQSCATGNYYWFEEGLILDYDKIYVSGGYFFKYSADNPFARVLPEFFKNFSKNQKIDLYCKLPKMITEDVIKTFTKKYSIEQDNKKFKVVTKEYFHKTYPDIKLTLNYWKHPNENIPVNYFFDSDFCNVEYWIKENKFRVSNWFHSDYNTNDVIDNLFRGNISIERKLKFKMKGLYTIHDDEINIRYALLKTQQAKIDLTPTQFKQLLESQDRFAHLKHDLIADCNHIDTIFEQPLMAKNNDYSFAQCLILDYDKIYVSGGYFFKYSADNPFARVLPELFKNFSKNQMIDLYCLSRPSLINNDIYNDISEYFKKNFLPKYVVKSDQGQDTVYTTNVIHNQCNITLNYWLFTEYAPLNHYFDADFCNVEYWIKERVFRVSNWFHSDYDTNDVIDDLFRDKNVSNERKLKFKMKGLYTIHDEINIRSVTERLEN